MNAHAHLYTTGRKLGNWLIVCRMGGAKGDLKYLSENYYGLRHLETMDYKEISEDEVTVLIEYYRSLPS